MKSSLFAKLIHIYKKIPKLHLCGSSIVLHNCSLLKITTIYCFMNFYCKLAISTFHICCTLIILIYNNVFKCLQPRQNELLTYCSVTKQWNISVEVLLINAKSPGVQLPPLNTTLIVLYFTHTKWIFKLQGA